MVAMQAWVASVARALDEMEELLELQCSNTSTVGSNMHVAVQHKPFHI